MGFLIDACLGLEEKLRCLEDTDKAMLVKMVSSGLESFVTSDMGPDYWLKPGVKIPVDWVMTVAFSMAVVMETREEKLWEKLPNTAALRTATIATMFGTMKKNVSSDGMVLMDDIIRALYEVDTRSIPKDPALVAAMAALERAGESQVT
jgi:hypothetical protein